MFLRNWGEIEERIDPYYYKKIYIDLERKISLLTDRKLRDFIHKMTGGMTPNTSEYDKYYTNSSNGIPFIRVQNLSPEGLQLENCKYINQETHNGLLARSKVFENDLLIKITGVGRMAVTSIAPKNFEGNINQHIVVIKSKDIHQNPLIATFLNSDIGEMLATRRTTGGTRPALNYQALRSIPIVLNKKIVSIIDSAYESKKQKEVEAQALLNSINSYLLDELGIIMPQEAQNIIENRMFYIKSNKVIGGRFDPKNYSKKYSDIFNAIENSSLSRSTLRSLLISDVSGSWGLDETEEGEDLIKCLTIRATEFDNRFNLKLNNNRVKFRKYTQKAFDKINLSIGDILVEKSGGSEDQPVGRVAIIDEEIVNGNTLAFSNFIHKIVVNTSVAYPQYVFEYLNLMHKIKATEVMQTQTNGIRNLIMDEYFSQIVLLPNLDKQKEISSKIKSIRHKAKQLEFEARQDVDNAKLKVEHILLGE